MPVDHYSLIVPSSKFEGMIAFCIESLKHTGFKEWYRPAPHAAGLGEGTPYFWIAAFDSQGGESDAQLSVLKRQHIAFTAKNHEEVDQFYAAALKAGGEDNGAPGPRPQYGPTYYAAFIRDPCCGVNFEMVYKEATKTS